MTFLCTSSTWQFLCCSDLIVTSDSKTAILLPIMDFARNGCGSIRTVNPREKPPEMWFWTGQDWSKCVCDVHEHSSDVYARKSTNWAMIWWCNQHTRLRFEMLSNCSECNSTNPSGLCWRTTLTSLPQDFSLPYYNHQI